MSTPERDRGNEQHGPAGRTTRDPPDPPSGEYERYRLPTEEAPDLVDTPPRFRVDVKKRRLALLLAKELVEHRGDWKTVKDPPCIYGVFDGPVGGFNPREELCVGCLRCTTQHPDVVNVRPNPDRRELGDGHLTPDLATTILHEARTGQIPVKGQGYRGSFGGDGWDGLWTDMSEIVRPTRDGIHGREFISTAVELGPVPPVLDLDDAGEPAGDLPRTVRVPVPILLDAPPGDARDEPVLASLRAAAEAADTLAVLPAPDVVDRGLAGDATVPLVAPGDGPALEELPGDPRLVEVDGWHPSLVRDVRAAAPDAVVAVRLPLGAGTREAVDAAREEGVGTFHVAADLHGRGEDGRFVRDHLRDLHTGLVEDGLRDEVSVVASGGIVAAEHVPKAILCGADAVALDTAALVALQVRLEGECRSRETARVEVPDLEAGWGAQRLTNLLGAWRDQLLEVLGAMGMREVRRLRGEVGRSMRQEDLEREAFGDIPGFPDGGDPPGGGAGG